MDWAAGVAAAAAGRRGVGGGRADASDAEVAFVQVAVLSRLDLWAAG